MSRVYLAFVLALGLIVASALLLASAAAQAQAPSANPVLFWYETQQGIWRVEAGGEPVQIMQPAESGSVHGFDVARDTEHLYWLQLGPGDMPEHIRRANLDGSEQQAVVDAYYGMYYVHDTRVHGDWIYWTVYVSWASGTISFLRAPRDGSGSSAVLPADPPWYILAFAVDTDDGHLFWLGRYSSGGPSAVRRSNLDGSDPASLITGGSILRSIALDRGRAHIYWSEDNRIMRADYDAENIVEVLASDGSVHQLALDPLADRIYWTDANRLVWRAALDGSGVEQFFQLPPAAQRFAIFPQQPKGAEEQPAERVVLEQSYPNPAGHEVIIRFTLLDPAHVRLDLFDVLGRRITTLAVGAHAAGGHELVLDSSRLAPGMYTYRLTSGDESRSRNLVVVPR